MVEVQTSLTMETTEETPEEEFGLVAGTLGHAADEPMPEVFFNASLWEDRKRPEQQPALAF